MTPDSLRKSYLDYMSSIGAKAVPTSSLLPENDPTTLFTGSGMQPMVPYLLGEKHPSGGNIANIQKCIRTGDIDIVGDSSHLTFFEMTGRWAFQADSSTYKKIQIQAIWDWQVNILGLDPKNLYISVYQGSTELKIDQDNEAIAIWSELFKSVGIDPIVESEAEKFGVSRGGRIFTYGDSENWWSRVGVPKNMPIGEPGGPDSEMFFDFDPEGDNLDHPATDTERFLEIGNNVFMSLKKEASGFVSLNNPNIDYGGGLERIAAAVNGDPDLYLTPFFKKPIEKLTSISNINYQDSKKEFRIILDHLRAATFLISDGAVPSNTDAGYITRRLIRRAIRTAKKINITDFFVSEISEIYIDESKNAYPLVYESKDKVLSVILAEEKKFHKTLLSGEREIVKFLAKNDNLTGEDAFYFYETYGFPLELTEEILKEKGKDMKNPELFNIALKKHSDLSRTASAGKFKGGLAEHSEMTTALHTATHLMLAGLREVLGEHVFQKGSNITDQRARFDFSHGAKVTKEEVQKVEEFVNQAIKACAAISVQQMPKQQAKDENVIGSFWEKYPEVVKVYIMQDESGKLWSKELCGGPHVENTKDLGKFGVFKIKKEQSSSAGVRRIKAVLA